MKIIPNVHDYLIEQTLNIRRNLAKDGRFDNNNIIAGRNLGLDLEIHSRFNFNSKASNYINENYVAENSEEEKMLRKFTRITNFIQDGSSHDYEMITKLRHIAQKMNKLKTIAK